MNTHSEEMKRPDKIPLYFGKQFLGIVPFGEGRATCFTYLPDLKRPSYVKNVYWKLCVTKYGSFYYKFVKVLRK